MEGQGDDAITLLANKGGIDMDANILHNVSISGGQVALVSKDAVAGAISLLADKGGDETITIKNMQGTTANAIQIHSEWIIHANKNK